MQGRSGSRWMQRWQPSSPHSFFWRQKWQQMPAQRHAARAHAPQELIASLACHCANGCRGQCECAGRKEHALRD